MKRVILSIIVTALIFINGCIAVKPKKAKETVVRDYLVYDIGTIPSELEMLKSEDVRQRDLLPILFEGLVKYSGFNEKTGMDSIVPGIAESWTINSDDTVYTFKIRENALWSDGARITAYDFVHFFDDMLSPERENINDYELFCISGAKEYRKGKNRSKTPAIRALSSDALEIKLDYPCSYFLDTLAEPVYCLRKLDNSLKNWNSAYKNLCCSGPFKIQSINKNNEIVLQGNEGYWNKNDVKCKEIVITASESSEESCVRFKKNDVDVFFNPPESEIEGLSENENINTVPSVKASYIAFNFKGDAPCRSIDLRKAIAFSSDKASIAAKSDKFSTVETFAFKPSFTLNSNEKNKTSDVKDLNKNLSSTLRFIFENSKSNKAICKNIAESAEKSFKIKINLCPCDAEELQRNLKNGDYDIAKVDIEGDSNYPIILFQKFVSKSDFNSFGYSNKAYDKLMDAVMKEQKKNIRSQYVQKAADILSKDIPIIPLYYYDTILCKSKNVTGIKVTKKGNIILDNAHLKLP